MLLSTTTLRFLPLHTPSPPATPQIHLRRSPTLITFPFPTLPRRTRISHAPAFSDDRPPEAADVSDSGDGVRVSVARIGINKRRVQASVGIGAALDVVWAVITDYEGLAEFIPSLSVCRLLERSGSFVKIYQVGQQDLGLGLKFNAKGVLDCYEKGVEEVGDCRRREIDFKMVEGDFQTFEGTWSMIEETSSS